MVKKPKIVWETENTSAKALHFLLRANKINSYLGQGNKLACTIKDKVNLRDFAVSFCVNRLLVTGEKTVNLDITLW